MQSLIAVAVSCGMASNCGLLMLLVVCVSVATVGEADADELSVSGQKPVERLQVVIEQIEPTVATGSRPDRGGDFQIRLSLRVRISNRTAAPVMVRARDFALIANGVPSSRGTFSPGPELTDGELQPGAEMEGWLWFGDIDCSQGEPILGLNWKSELQTTVDSVIVSVNEEIRRLTAAEKELTGPDNCLIVIRVSRNLDLLSGWVLQDMLRDFSQQGLRRLVIKHRMTTAGQISEETLSWLSSWKQSELPDPADSPAGIPAAGGAIGAGGGRFIEIHLGNFDRFSGRRLPGSGEGVMLHRRDDDAVTAAIRTVYSQIGVERILVDVVHADAGIRRAAIAACSDRLDDQQTRNYLQLLTTAPPERQSELLEPMYMMSHADVLPVLQQLSLSQHAEVSAGALNALTRSGDPEVLSVVNELWQISSTQQDLRNRLVTAALGSRDYRWCSLLALYARELLYLHVDREAERTRSSALAAKGAVVRPLPKPNDARPLPEVIGVGDPPPPAQAPGDPPDEGPVAGKADQRSRKGELPGPGPGSMAASLPEVLTFLRQHQHEGVLDACRSLLLEIRDPGVQDIVIDFLMHWRSDSDLELISQYLAQRMAGDQITETVRNTAYQYPNPAWTPYLLKDFQNARSQSVSQRKSLTAALRSASNEQLDDLLAQFLELDVSSQGLILSHLAAVEFPGWRSFVQAALKQHSGRFREALDVLHQDGSDESIRILNEHLLELLNADVDWKSGAGELALNRLQPLISQVSLISHPESQRVLNRCLRHSDQRVRKYTRQAIGASHRRSPAYSRLIEVQELKQAQKYEEALTKADEAIEQDSFLSESFLFRASLLLRQDRLDEALRDLQRADLLCPEELSTLSTIALVRVRQGDLIGGLKLADETLLLDPEEESTLYNTACVYGRAVEAAEINSEQKLKYLDETLRLLKLSIAAGFSDPDHLQQDPDLACLHSHSAWQDVIRSVEENQNRAKGEIPEP